MADDVKAGGTSHSSARTKMETTDRVSRSIIDDERVQREKKTARLQIARLERDAAAEAPAKAAGKTAGKGKSKKG